MKAKSLVALLLCSCCCAVFGQEISKVQTLQLAKQLAVYGYENESVSALLQSANLFLDVNPKKIELAMESQGQASSEAPQKSFSFTPEELVHAAKELAGKDETFKEWIRKTERRLSGSRGATTTPQYTSSFANGNDGYTTCKISFKANEVAEVYISSLDYADLDLYVYDEYGNLVACDENYNTDCSVSFCPKYTSDFTILVKNRTPYNASYLLVTN